MGIRPRALYSDLLYDLAPWLPSSVRNSLDQGFDVDYWGDMDRKQRACLSLAKSFYKKFVDTTSKEAEPRALEKFLSINERMANFVLEPRGSWEEEMVGTLKDVLYRFFSPVRECPDLKSDTPGCSGHLNGELLHIEAILDRARSGPGASLGANGNDFYTKMFSSRLTTTRRSHYELYARHVSMDYRWQSAEELRKLTYGAYDVVEGNRLNFVPKTKDIARTICTEPSLNMWCQLGIGAILEERLERYFGINLSNQQFRNRRMARIGSIDGSFATIDLSNASDSMSRVLLREVLPQSTNWWLDFFRSPLSILPDGRKIELHMISTMGNGYTFPLQTILFASAVVAVYRALGIPLIRPRGKRDGNFGVFGDDIIVVRKAYPTLCRFLETLGFSVNHDKSFSEGPFRESCGEDYFLGHNVRGVYLTSIAEVQDRYSAINRLNRWSAFHGVSLENTIQRLASSVPKYLVPQWEQDDAGIKVPYSLVRRKRLDKRTQSIVYRRWVAVPSKLRVTDDAILGPRKERRRLFNPEGLRLALLHGGLKSGEIAIRLDRVPYRPKFGVAPNWDAISVWDLEQMNTAHGKSYAMAPQLLVGEDFARWERAVEENHGDSL